MRNKRLITYFMRSHKICYHLNSDFAEFPRKVLKIPEFQGLLKNNPAIEVRNEGCIKHRKLKLMTAKIVK